MKAPLVLLVSISLSRMCVRSFMVVLLLACRLGFAASKGFKGWIDSFCSNYMMIWNSTHMLPLRISWLRSSMVVVVMVT